MEILLLDRITKHARAGYKHIYTCIYAQYAVLADLSIVYRSYCFECQGKIIIAVYLLLLLLYLPSNKTCFPLGHASYLVYDELMETKVNI